LPFDAVPQVEMVILVEPRSLPQCNGLSFVSGRSGDEDLSHEGQSCGRIRGDRFCGRIIGWRIPSLMCRVDAMQLSRRRWSCFMRN